MLKSVSARSILNAFNELLDLGAPARDYPVSTAEDITSSAWKATGESMRHSMNQIDAEIGRVSHPLVNH